MSWSWLWSLIARVATALWDRVRAEVNARKLGEAEERERALKEAQRQEEEARKAAEEAAKKPIDEDDGWGRA